MIEVRNLTKRYRDRVAVDDLTFTVQPGRITGFLGPNGAGKSTTMRLILGLDVPTGGTALIDGRPFAEHAWPLRTVGAVLDPKSFHPNRSARNHLMALAATVGEAAPRVDHVLRLVGLDGVADDRAGQYSLGMSQRLGVAAALLGDPKVLILDEPINGLDPDGVRWMRQLLKSLADEGRTVFLSSHLMSEMSQTADHLVVIGRGRLIADMSMADLLKTAEPLVRVRSLQQERLHSLLIDRGAEVAVETDGRLVVRHLDPDEIALLAMRNQVVLIELAASQQSLEDVFMELTAATVEYTHNDPTNGSHH